MTTADPVSDHAPVAATAADVYRPQADTYLLIEALRRLPVTGRRVLDVCTGAGPVAAASAELGARSVVAIDTCPRAVATAAALRPTGPAWTCVQATVADFAPAAPFELVTCNPPYVPAPGPGIDCPSPAGPTQAWDAGPDGREVLDALCARATALVEPGGSLLLVQSLLADPAKTAMCLRDDHFGVTEVLRRRIPFGPVLRSRRSWLVDCGLIGPDQWTETLCVLLARRETSEGPR
ncbi:hypothetical protein GOHSU_13_00150 [Gordonia hirsuta DSM 44140 = NBRC 16056]|uniref:Methyltransferase small domain-containing protein n=1 Tax=Gordonia hirsuta DSM 44140 = NBRC 16056 TaxID=1121927 RepID=L7L9S5_9ACTN|nr:methyltransferase [Gordonia hirsuta]GAC56793.1 hypothetical protein GOHSU_13_00150 [Gordonia hirsuta DSM 44140 = NBRC 16056]